MPSGICFSFPSLFIQLSYFRTGLIPIHNHWSHSSCPPFLPLALRRNSDLSHVVNLRTVSENEKNIPTYSYTIPIFSSQLKLCRCCCCRCCRCYSPLAHMKTTIETSQPKISCQPPRNILWCCKHQGTRRIHAAQAELFVMVTTEKSWVMGAYLLPKYINHRNPSRKLTEI